MTKYIAGCLALLAMLAGCSDSREAGPPGSDLRLQLVDQARWAMSAHNMQPWEIGARSKRACCSRGFG